MRCRDVEACWDDMRSGQEPRRGDVLAHLRACPDCQAVYAEYEGVAYCLSCLPVVEAPQSMVPQIMAHIRHQCEQVHIRATVALSTVPTPIGPVHVGYREQGIVFLSIDRGEGLRGAASALEHRLRASALPVTEEPPAWVRGALDAFFASGRTTDAPVDLSDVTDFERAVLRAAAQIPPGEVRSYGWVARAVGKPNSARAVGQALANNPVPLLIPCHRVIDCKGRLNRYLYGVEMKRRLLDLEGFREEERSSDVRTC
ncbi:MAG TPA: methylated-DNA--[protein]-cysteine S-methyltransferase [Candidatus Dormibacteraeota bacterium]|nr:methylated-DNA--[protein]-cysteine S-methyltransferase [Candidatus Dormibacteraeota bacterium]